MSLNRSEVQVEFGGLGFRLLAIPDVRPGNVLLGRLASEAPGFGI